MVKDKGVEEEAVEEEEDGEEGGAPEGGLLPSEGERRGASEDQPAADPSPSPLRTGAITRTPLSLHFPHLFSHASSDLFKGDFSHIKN